MATVVAAAARWQCSAWQCNGSVKPWHYRGMAAPAVTNAVLPPCATVVAMKTPAAKTMVGAHGSDSDGGGTNNQHSTKSTDTATMTATAITMGTKGTAVAEEAR